MRNKKYVCTTRQVPERICCHKAVEGHLRFGRYYSFDFADKVLSVCSSTAHSISRVYSAQLSFHNFSQGLKYVKVDY